MLNLKCIFDLLIFKKWFLSTFRNQENISLSPCRKRKMSIGITVIWRSLKNLFHIQNLVPNSRKKFECT